MNGVRTNQRGLGTVEILIVGLVVVVLGITGFAVFRHSLKTGVKSSTTPATSQTAAKPNSTTTQSAQPIQKHLVIKEWGVTIPYTNSDTFSYALTAGGQSATIGSSSLASKDSTCIAKGAGVIERFAPTDSASVYGSTTVADSAKQNPGTYVYVGGYYYLFVHAQSACGSSISASDQNQANNTVKSALAQLQTASTN